MSYYGYGGASRSPRTVIAVLAVVGAAFIGGLLWMAGSLGKVADGRAPAGASVATASGARTHDATAAVDAAEADPRSEDSRGDQGPSVDQALASLDDRMAEAESAPPAGGIEMDPTGNKVKPVSPDQAVDHGYVGSSLPDSAPRGVADDFPVAPDLPEGYEGRGRVASEPERTEPEPGAETDLPTP